MSTWRYLRSLAWTFKWTLSLDIFVQAVLIAALEHGFVLIIREIFDTMTGDARTSLGVWTLCAVLAGVVAFQMVLYVGSVTLQFANQFMIGALLRRNVLAHLMELSGMRGLPASPGEAVTRFRGDASSAGRFYIWPKFIVTQLLVSIVAIAIMVSISPFVTLIGLLPIILVYLVVHFARTRIERTRKQSREAAGDVTGFLGEMFGSAEAIKVAGAEDHVLNEFDRVNAARKQATLRDTLLTQTLNAVFRNLEGISVGAILIVAGHAMLSGELTVGDLVLFVFYLEQFSWLSRGLGQVMTEYRQLGVGLGRLDELMPGAPPEKLVERNPTHLFRKAPDPAPVEKTEADRLESLEVSGLTYLYPDSERGVHEVDLSLRKGSFTVITGRVGAGKSTLLRVLLGSLPLQGGRAALEREAGRGRERGPGAAARGLHVAGAASVQRGAAGEYFAGTPRGRCGPAGGRAFRRAGRRHRRSGRRAGHGGRAARGEAVRGTAEEGGGGAHVRPGAGTAGLRRPVERSRRGDRAGPCGSGWRNGRTGRCWRSRTGGRLFVVPTILSCSRTDGWRLRGSWTSCWGRLPRCRGCGRGTWGAEESRKYCVGGGGLTLAFTLTPVSSREQALALSRQGESGSTLTRE